MKEKLEFEVALKVKADMQDAAGLSKEDKETLKFVARELAWKANPCPGGIGATVKELEDELRRINALPTIEEGLTSEARICRQGSEDCFIDENEFANVIASMALSYANQYRKPQQ